MEIELIFLPSGFLEKVCIIWIAKITCHHESTKKDLKILANFGITLHRKLSLNQILTIFVEQLFLNKSSQIQWEVEGLCLVFLQLG